MAWYLLWGAILAVTIGCGGTTPEIQLNDGEKDYVTFCAACHEPGQGIGPVLTAEVLDDRVTAARLFAYNRDKMPYSAERTLTDEQYWAITAYLVIRSGFMPVDSIVLGLHTADGVVLQVDD